MAVGNSQPAFATGEWAPKLRSRVDIQRYRTGAALMRNFFVDFAGGGASTRQGTKFINQAFNSNFPVRLVSFQPSVNISYVLEFGQNYIRFYSNGAPILEAAVPIQSITTGPPLVVNSTAHGYANGDWVFISGAYYIVASATANTYQLTDLFGNPITSLIGTQGQRVYTLSVPYLASDLFPNQSTGNPGIKFAQDVTSLIITHPNYSPGILTIISANSWTFSTIRFGPTVAAPSVTASSNFLAAGNWCYSYVVTAVDNNGQESAPSAPANLNNVQDVRSTQGGIIVSWNVIAGAVSYNIYKASETYGAATPAGAPYGFIGNATGNSFHDDFAGIAPDFSQTPPIIASPTVGGTVQSIVLTTNSPNYTVIPGISISAAPPGGFTATAFATLTASVVTLTGGNLNSTQGFNPVGTVLNFPFNIVCRVNQATEIGGTTFWTINQIQVLNTGSLTGTAGNSIPNPLAPTTIASSPPGVFIGNVVPNISNTWIIQSVSVIQGGFGYTSNPTVVAVPPGPALAATISPINSTGSGQLGAAPVGNPRCVEFYQERLCFASPNSGLQSFYMSQPGSFFNFNVSDPSQADDGIFGSIIGTELNDIRSLVAVPTGLLALTGKGAWLINGGGGISTSTPVTPSNVTATPQAFNGANDLRPLRTNLDLLYVTNKGNYVRDQTYNIYANIFTGTDITYLSNHLFFDYTLTDWAWAEEPFKVAWCIRNDGNLLSLTYLKDQELIGWAHHDTNGMFKSVCTVIETVGDVANNTVDAVYFAIQRVIQGQIVTYIERMADRYFTYGYESAWSVDCGLRTTPSQSPSSTLIVVGNVTAVGNSVSLSDAVGAPFTSGMVGWIVRAGGGIYAINTFTSSSSVSASVVRPPPTYNWYTGSALPQTGYTIWQPTSTVSGLTQLIGQSVVGVADGIAVGPLTVSGTGSVTLPSPATKVTLGLAYTPQLQTLPLDLGGKEEIQGKRVKIAAVTLRVADTLGLQIGTSFSTLTTMKDLQIGAIPSTSSGVAKVVDLINPGFGNQIGGFGGRYVDARTVLDQVWQEAGSYCIQQNLPFPATVLGAYPELEIGDKP